MSKKSNREKEETKRDNQKYLLGIAVVALFVVALLAANADVSKSDSDDLDMGASGNCAVTVNYYGYYEDEVVQTPVVNAPWTIGDILVDALGVDISWTVSGENMDWTTLDVSGSLHLYRLDYSGQNPTDITPVGVGEPFSYSGTEALTGFEEYNIPLSTLLSGVIKSGVTNEGVDYWTIKAEVNVIGEATDDYGENFTDSTGVMFATWTIYDATGTASDFSIDGNIT